MTPARGVPRAPGGRCRPREAVGRVAAESLAAYPPGIPNVLPGERLTAETLDYVQPGARPRRQPARGQRPACCETVRVAIEARGLRPAPTRSASRPKASIARSRSSSRVSSSRRVADAADRRREDHRHRHVTGHLGRVVQGSAGQRAARARPPRGPRPPGARRRRSARSARSPTRRASQPRPAAALAAAVAGRRRASPRAGRARGGAGPPRAPPAPATAVGMPGARRSTPVVPTPPWARAIPSTASAVRRGGKAGVAAHAPSGWCPRARPGR